VGLYLIELKDGERSFSYWRGQSAARRLAEDETRLNRALAGAEVAYLSGITLAILPPPDRARLLAALDGFPRARAAASPSTPTCAIRLWPSPEAMTDAVTEAARIADIALPSFEDDAGAFGDADPQACARRYAALGAGEVVVKNGAGRMAALVEGAWHAHDPDPAPQVVDTTAAGDSFNAGYLACRLTGGSVAGGAGGGLGPRRPGCGRAGRARRRGGGLSASVPPGPIQAGERCARSRHASGDRPSAISPMSDSLRWRGTSATKSATEVSAPIFGIRATSWIANSMSGPRRRWRGPWRGSRPGSGAPGAPSHRNSPRRTRRSAPAQATRGAGAVPCAGA
jgi:sugar/nucleoside kinase (ribokinase family)